MGVFLAILMMVTTGSVAIFLVVRMVMDESLRTEKIKLASLHMIVVVLLILADVLLGRNNLTLRLQFDMILSLFSMLALTSSLCEEQDAIRLARYLSFFVWILMICYLLQRCKIIPAISPVLFISFSGIICILICGFYLVALALRMREIRKILRNGDVWSSVCFNVDIIYMLALIVCVIAFFLSLNFSFACARIIAGVVAFFMTGELAALGLRVASDSLFVVWRSHERRIVESMKISHSEVVQDSSKISEMYKDIYTRVVTLFETEKPYLNSELTINDIVKVTFTNRLYISRAISQFTGRNFCQFVNYYRVLHSIKLFRNNPDLKVIELATQSGFNSTVSFSMAFRLYMNECPSDWCRKEKLKLNRRKK